MCVNRRNKEAVKAEVEQALSSECSFKPKTVESVKREVREHDDDEVALSIILKPSFIHHTQAIRRLLDEE